MKADLIIADEGHFASNRKARRTEALGRLKAEYKILSSATPYGNKFEGNWAIARWLWGDLENPNFEPPHDRPSYKMYVDRSFHRWKARWCATTYDPFTFDNVRITGELNPGEWVQWIPTYIYVKSQDVPVENRNVYVDLHPEQRRLWDELAQNALAWVNENPLAASLPMVKKYRLRQITLGVPTVEVSEDGEYEVSFTPGAHSSKLDALEKILKLHKGERVVVYIDSARFLPVILDRLGDQAVEWSGRRSMKQRDEAFDAFSSGQARVLVATIPSIGEGLDGLQHITNIEVWLSASYNEVLNDQARGRVQRQGQTKTVLRYHVFARDTDDTGDFTRLLEQQLQRKEVLRK